MTHCFDDYQKLCLGVEEGGLGLKPVVTGAADGAEGEPLLGDDAGVKAEGLQLLCGFGDVGKR